jgi:hypothetical protein
MMSNLRPVTIAEPVAHPATRRARAELEYAAIRGLSNAQFRFLHAVVEGHRGEALRARMISASLAPLEASFQAQTGASVYHVALEILETAVRRSKIPPRPTGP